MKAPILLAVVVLAAGGTWYALSRTSPEAPPEVPAAPQPKATGEAGPAAPAAPVEVRPAPAPIAKTAEARVEYPDGSCYPLLNGVQQTLRPTFHPRMVPFTKVVGIVRDGLGREWYVHENGARSTVYLDPTGKAVAEVEAPKPAQPSVDEPTGR